MKRKNFLFPSIFIGVIFTAGFFLNVVSAQCEEIAVAFTGQANAALYPCSCPKNPEGGVARRGAAIKKLRREHPHLLVVEAGMSFASGPQDESAQNVPLDMRRTEIYLLALKTMDIDAMLLSGQEFVFAADFLERFKNIPFLSSNEDGVGAPFILKKMGSVTVGILGLTDVLARSRGASTWRAPEQIIGAAVKAIRNKGATFVLVLSALSPQEDESLFGEVKGVDVIINGSPSYGPVSLKKIGGASHWVGTWWQAKKIGLLVFDVSGRDSKMEKLDIVNLDSGVEDDPDVKALLPACFQSGDCKKKPGSSALCENAGMSQAMCSYIDVPAIPVTVIVPRNCKTCRTQETIKSLDKMLGNVKPLVLFEDTSQAQTFIKNLRLKMLPAYIADVSIEKLDSFSYIRKSLKKEGPYYVFAPQMTGVSYFIDRRPLDKRLDVFFDFTYPLLKILCDRLAEFKNFHPDVDLHFHFLAAGDQKTGYKLRPGSTSEDVDEFKRAACINEFYPDSFLSYIGCRAEKKDPALWEACANDAGIDAARIKKSAQSAEGETLFKDRIKLTKELEIAVGPTFLVDNKEVFGIAGVPTEKDFEKEVFGGPVQEEKKRGSDENKKTK